MTLTCSRSKVSMYIPHAPEAPIFLHFALRWAPLLTYGILFEKGAPNDPKTTLNVPPTYTPKAQIFGHFALQWPVFEKSAQNDVKMTLTCSRSKYLYVYYIQPPGPNFCRFFYGISFLSYMYIPLFRKVHWMAPKWPGHIQGRKYQICIPYTPQRLKFSSVSPYDVPFLSYSLTLKKVHQITTK